MHLPVELHGQARMGHPSEPPALRLVGQQPDQLHANSERSLIR